MKKYILFDLDGTVVNSQEGIIKSAYFALDAMGITEDEPEKLERFIGPPLLDSFKEFYELNDRGAAKAVEKYRERYKAKGVFESRPYPKIEEVLDRLKAEGKCLCIATSKAEYFAKQMLEIHELHDRFEHIVGADETRITKTDVIKSIIERLGSPDPASIIMVGDRKHDVIGAHDCGVECIGVEYGFAESGEFEAAGTEYTAATMDELLELLLKL